MKRLLFIALILPTLGCDRKDAPDKKEIAALEHRLHDKEPAIQAKAARDLAKYGPDAAMAVPALTAALSSEDLFLRQSAALTLGKIGPASKKAVGVLRHLLTDPDAKVRENAVFALGEIGDRSAYNEVQAMRADGITAVRRAAIEATEKLKR
jgi:HEAT repeat protein